MMCARTTGTANSPRGPAGLAARGVMQQRALAGPPLNIMIGFGWQRGGSCQSQSWTAAHRAKMGCRYGHPALAQQPMGPSQAASLRPVASCGVCAVDLGSQGRRIRPGWIPSASCLMPWAKGHRGISTSRHVEVSTALAWAKRPASAHRPERRLIKMPPAWALLKRRCRDHQSRMASADR